LHLPSLPSLSNWNNLVWLNANWAPRANFLILLGS